MSPENQAAGWKMGQRRGGAWTNHEALFLRELRYEKNAKLNKDLIRDLWMKDDMLW